MSNRKKVYCAIIEWTDASLFGSDQLGREEAEAARLADGVSCGILVADLEDRIILAQDWFPKDNRTKDQFRSVSVYPKEGIKTIRKVLLRREDEERQAGRDTRGKVRLLGETRGSEIPPQLGSPQQ